MLKELKALIQRFLDRQELFLFGNFKYVVYAGEVSRVGHAPNGDLSDAYTELLNQEFRKKISWEGNWFILKYANLLPQLYFGFDRFYGQTLRSDDGSLFLFGQFLPTPFMRAWSLFFLNFFLFFFCPMAILITAIVYLEGEVDFDFQRLLLVGLEIIFLIAFPFLLSGLTRIRNIFLKGGRDRLLTRLATILPDALS